MIQFKESKALKELDSVSLAEMLREHFIVSYPAHQGFFLGEAIQVASYLHRNDIRRGARGVHRTPSYIEHPLRVAYRMVRNFGVSDPNLIIAAVLHDTVEDHAHDFADFEGVSSSSAGDEVGARRRALIFIRDTFNKDVRNIVHAVSNPVLEPGVSKAEKVAIYLEHVSAEIRKSPEARILKFSDFVDNAGSLHHHYTPGEKALNYFLDRYTPLLDVYQEAFQDCASREVYNSLLALRRLDQVRAQFDTFEAARV